MNLSDNIPGCKYFTWKEALWLPQWSRAADESDGLTEDILSNLITTFGWMDKVRDFFGSAVRVHEAYRPEAYNELVHGAKNSAHKYGQAVDFDVIGVTCDVAREQLKSKLDDWNLRMEDLPQGSGWVHLDDRQPGPKGRFFKP